MNPRLGCFALAVVVAGLREPAERCSLEELIPRITDSARTLAEALSGAVAWEDYDQEVLEVEDRSASLPMKLLHNAVLAHRRLGSDVLLLRLPSGSFYGFRDVAQVDGQEVAERGQRIQKLFLSEGKDPNETKTLIEESARFNIGDIERNLNLPTLILPLLLSDASGDIERLSLALEGNASERERTCAVSFRETRPPYLVGTGQGASCRCAELFTCRRKMDGSSGYRSSRAVPLWSTSSSRSSSLASTIGSSRFPRR